LVLLWVEAVKLDHLVRKNVRGANRWQLASKLGEVILPGSPEKQPSAEKRKEALSARKLLPPKKTFRCPRQARRGDDCWKELEE